MFDVGFWELCLVGLVSLLVIGPEKLPKAARVAGFWLGKTRNMLASAKAEMQQELQAEEMDNGHLSMTCHNEHFWTGILTVESGPLLVLILSLCRIYLLGNRFLVCLSVLHRICD